MNKKKICLLGVFGSGKTSLTRRFVHDSFNEKYLTTVGVNILQKVVPVDDDQEPVHMLIWDIEGADQSLSIPVNYYIGSSGAIIVMDLLRKETIAEVPAIIDKFLEYAPDSSIVIAGNKHDLMDDEHADNLKEIKKFAKNNNYPLYLTSAKTGDNVEKCFLSLGHLIKEYEKAKLS